MSDADQSDVAAALDKAEQELDAARGGEIRATQRYEAAMREWRRLKRANDVIAERNAIAAMMKGRAETNAQDVSPPVHGVTMTQLEAARRAFHTELSDCRHMPIGEIKAQRVRDAIAAAIMSVQQSRSDNTTESI